MSDAPEADFRPRRSPLLRICAAFTALGFAGAALGTWLMWLACRLSLWTFVLGSSAALIAAGGTALTLRRRWARQALLAGLAAFGLPLLGRVLFVHDSANVNLVTLPDGGTRWIDRLYPESDGALAAASLVSTLGALRDADAPRFAQIMRAAGAGRAGQHGSDDAGELRA